MLKSFIHAKSMSWYYFCAEVQFSHQKMNTDECKVILRVKRNFPHSFRFIIENCVVSADCDVPNNCVYGTVTSLPYTLAVVNAVTSL
jgi:hypothetical protein